MIPVYVYLNENQIEQFELTELQGVSMSWTRWPKYNINSIGFTKNCLTVFLEDKSD